MSRLLLRPLCVAVAAGLLLFGAAGCGDKSEKAVIPEKFTPPPPNGPTVTGGAPAPNPGAQPKKGGKGAAPADL